MLKRAVDFLIALTAILIFSPVIILIAFTNLIFLRLPIFFVQQRPGRGGKPFNLIKFRTMKVDGNGDASSLPDAMRLNAYGRFLRSTSLDELPGLWNVVKGEMSLVGPRPLLMEYLPLYTAQQGRRHNVRPGITGWAQVNGRNTISWEEKFEADLWYVDNQSLALDLKILFMTVLKVFQKEGISANGEATMPKFTGTKS